ncbi:interleukin-21 isoform X2 [Pseudorasbora parva]
MIQTLNKVMHELEKIQKGMGQSNISIHSPTTNDLKDCCIASALECFRTNVLNLTVTDARLKKSQIMLKNELRKKTILEGLPSCSEIQKAQCKSCDSYSKVNSQTFVNNFQTLLQKIYASKV